MPDDAARPRFINSLFSVILFLTALLIALFGLFELRKLGTPAAPVAWVYGAVAASLIAPLALLPKLFFRLPSYGRLAAGLMVPVSIALLSVEVQQMAPAWDRTPEGIREIAEQRARDAERAVSERRAAADQAREAAEQRQRGETARALANLEATKKELEDVQAKLEGCFSWGHRLPALEDPVKASMHNPDAFEHVSTVLIVPDEQRNDVEMTFRAENGYGAIRTARVRAQLIADDCSVQNIGEPEIE